MTQALEKGPGLGKGEETGLPFSPEAVSEWMCSSYQETDKSCYVSKDSLFSDAVAYFKVQDNRVEKRHFFETLGRYMFGKHPSFMTIDLKSKKQIRGLKKRKKSRTSDNTATEFKGIRTDAQKKDPGKNRTDQKAPGMTYKLRDGSREDDRTLKQTCDNALEIRCKEMERNREDKTKRKKQTTKHQKEQNATAIMKSEETGGSRENEIQQKEQSFENSMEENEAEMKSEDKNGGREEEIEVKAQLCENSVEENEAEMKSEDKNGGRDEEIELNAQLCQNSVEQIEAEEKGEDKHGGREEEIEVKAQLCENSVEENEAEMKSEDKNGGREEEIELNAQLCENSVEQNEAEEKGEDKHGGREEEIEVKAQLCENSVEENEAEMKSEDKNGGRDEEIELNAQLCENSVEQNEAEEKGEDKHGGREEEIEVKAQLCENSVEQNGAEMKSEEKSGGREDEREQKEQMCKNSVEKNVAEIKCEEEDYSLGNETEWVEKYESNEADVEETYRTINATEIYCDDSRDSDDTKNILKQPYTIASAKDMFCNKALLTSRTWNNASIRDLLPQELHCKNFEKYLSFSVPKPLPRVNSEKRMMIYKTSAPTTSKLTNCLRAFLTKAFPPIAVCLAAAKDFNSLTFPGDVLPQFTSTCHSSLRSRNRFSIQCVVCPLYQDKCTREGVFSKLSCSGDLDGIAQTIVHHKSQLHQSALAYFSGSSATVTTAQSNFRDKETRQITIFQALKVDEPNTKVPNCLGFFENQKIVESLKDSAGIRRMTAKSLFIRERSQGKFHCFSKVGHEKCVNWTGWKERHPEEAEKLRESRSSRAAYITVNKKVYLDGKSIFINAAIKSLDPPCLGKPSGNINHPFTCDNCYKLRHYLIDLQKKRSQAKLKVEEEERVGKRGFRLDYATQTEVKEKLNLLTSQKKKMETMIVKINAKRDALSWEEMLHNSCKHDYQEKLIVDLLALFREDIDKTKPIQVTVLTNLVGKLKGNVNHKYTSLIKIIAKLHKTRLGETNYDLMCSLFGLPCSTTCDNYMLKKRLQPGFNVDVIQHAAYLYNGAPVIEASDEARALRFLQAVQTEDGEVVLIGKCWNADIDKWDNEVLRIPKKDEAKGDKDDFAALKRITEEIISSKQLASKVAIHNLCNMSGEKSHPLVYLMWPTPNKGYSGTHLLKIWSKTREVCAANDFNLIGHSVESAGFSLSASVQLMTPTESAVAEGINYLGLGVPDEKFLSPYFWRLPAIAYGDYDHLRRTFLRVLKYDTRNLTLYKDSRGSVIATISHLHELMRICSQIGQSLPFSANDLLLISFFDQRPDTANRIFTLKVAEMLHKHVKGSEGTCLFITAVHFLTEPFFNASYGSPEDIQKGLSTGITILRLWKRYLEIKKMKLHSQTNAAKIKERRGNFVTYGAYMTSELLFSAGTLHSLAMYLHFKHLGPDVYSPQRSGTIATEKIIGQLQGKTNQIQSLDTSPTYADMINKTKDLTFVTEALSELSTYEGVKVPATSNRKLSHFQVQKRNDTPYTYPCTYKEFLVGQRSMHRAGVQQAQEFVQKYLPQEFENTLSVNDCWDLPYTFTKPAGMVIVSDQPPSYNKLEFVQDVNSLNSVGNEVAMENLLEESEESDFVKNSTKFDEIYDDQEVNFSTTDIVESDEDDGRNSETSNSRISKWYIEKNGALIHIKKALKLLIPREFISKERSRRHWVADSLHNSLVPIDPSHDVIQFRDVAIRDGDGYFILHILSIISEDGRELVSTSSKRKHTIRGIIYRDVESNKYGFMSTLFVSRWIPVSKVLMEVVLESDSNDIAKLSEQSQLDLESVLANDVCSEVGLEEIPNTADDNKFYEVEEITDVRLNRQYHSEEYKVRFRGYGSDHDMWIPSSAFREPVQFQTVSKRGRVRKHKTKDECEVEVQRRKRQKQSNAVKASVSKASAGKSSRTTKRKTKSSTNSDGKKFRKSLQDLCQSDSDSGSDLEESPSYVHRKRKAGSETSLQLKFGKKQRLSEKTGVDSDRELDDGQLKNKVRRKKERKNSKESVKFIVGKENKSTGEVRRDEAESSASSSRGLWELKRKGDEGPFQVCRGSFHQSWHEDFQCPGQQCSSIALTSLLYGSITPIELWKPGDLDEVLLTGDRIHFNQLCYLGKSTGGVLKLALDELPKDLQCFNFQFFTEREILGGPIDKIVSSPDDDGFARLEDIFENCQRERAIGLLLRILDFTIACAQSYSSWYVIDSHARNCRGMVDENGSSVVLKFSNFHALLFYLRSFVETTTSERDLNVNDLTFEALILNVNERMPTESKDVLILPVSTLSSYQNRFGNIDVQSSFTACLEKGQEIKDSVLDFYFLHAAENQLRDNLKDSIYLYNSFFYMKLTQFNPKAIFKWTKNTDIFSKKYLIIPVCYGHHWILVIVRTRPHISLMILDSLNKEHRSVEVKITRYLQDVWSAKLPQRGKKTLEVKEIRYPTVPPQPNSTDCGLYIMKCFEKFLDFVNRNLQWSSWNPEFSHEEVLSFRRVIKHAILDEISNKKNNLDDAKLLPRSQMQ